MTRKIFTYAFLLGAIVMLICSAIFFGLQYAQTMEETYAALQGEASYAASGLEVGGIDYLRSLDQTNRVTWIARDGSVLYDSEFPELKTNQADFQEVRLALETGAGQGIRTSSSGGAQTMYYAFLCEDGTVLRLSRPLSAVRYALIAVSPILWVLLLVLLISGAAAFRIASRIAKPINEMNLDDLENVSVYPELQPLLTHMQEQRRMIEEQAVERENLRQEAARQKELQQREVIEQQERERREFTANVSHEMKTPLTSISGFAELMQTGLCDDEKMIEFAGDIYRESQRMIALVNDILHLSELDEGAMQQEQQMQPVSLVELAGNTVRRLRPAAQARRITMDVADETTQGQPAIVRGSFHILEEMIYNLCDNAIKYNREGGRVLVRVGTEEPQPDNPAENIFAKTIISKGTGDGRSVFLSVQDNGIGIPKEEQERVFERFYRVDKSHSRKIGGTGLGLSIVKHGAQFHDAAVEMESAPGQGTTITLRFPPIE